MAAVLAIGFIGYRHLFPAERSEVRACIAAMMEAGRGTLDYGMFRQALDEVDAADEVTILSITRTPFGPNEMLNIKYAVDGRHSGIVCAI